MSPCGQRLLKHTPPLGGFFSHETPPVLEELHNTPLSVIAECRKGQWCCPSEVIILLASGKQTWRQQARARSVPKRASRRCHWIPAWLTEFIAIFPVTLFWDVPCAGYGTDKVTPNTYTGITWGSGLSLDTLVLLLASGLVASASPPGEGHLKPPPLGVTPMDAVRFWGLCHWNMLLV